MRTVEGCPPAGDRRHRAGGVLTALAVMGLVVGLLPGVAGAHYDERGLGDAQLHIPHTPIGAPSEHPTIPVSARSFISYDKVLVFQCPPGVDDLDLLDNCLTIGASVTDSNGDFSTRVRVNPGMVTPDGKETFCQFLESPVGCSVERRPMTRPSRR